MQTFVEGLRYRMQPLENRQSWEAARKVMEESGGRELILGKAEELARSDRTVIVAEDRIAWNPRNYTLTLLWALRLIRAEDDFWDSKGVRIIASSLGGTNVDLQFGAGWHSLKDAASLKSRNPRVANSIDEESLDRKLDIAMNWAGYGRDFRFRKGYGTVNRKYAGSNISRIIYDARSLPRNR